MSRRRPAPTTNSITMKGFELTLFPNQKRKETHPDARGTLRIPLAVIGEIVAARKAGTLEVKRDDYNGTEFIALDASCWRKDPAASRTGRGPVLSIALSSLSETMERARELAEWKAQRDAENGGGGGWGSSNGNGNGGGGGWGAPAPQAAPQPNPQAGNDWGAPPETMGGGPAMAEEVPF